MFREARSTNPQVVDALQGRAALAADDGHAVAADQRAVDRAPALRTVQFRGRRRGFLHGIIIAAAVLAGCSSGPQRQPVIGEAYVGPMSLNLRAELAPRAPVTAMVKHGERLDILERRRRFVKVRTSSAAEGWTDGRQLLSPKQMARLLRTAEVARKSPSLGKASPFDTLNVHLAPNRQAPSFHQLKETEQVEVIGRKVTPRVPYAPHRKPEVTASTPHDAWSHVRLADGRAGWVLARMIMMAIPDEVAQYAEGHHITAYYSLGSIRDSSRDVVKHHWLWTTTSGNLHPHDFDSFRVFVYSTRRHAYETAYIERNVRGFHPVDVHPVPGSEMAQFALTFAGKDGVLAKRTYEFQGFRVRMIAKAPWQIAADEFEESDAPSIEEPQPPKPPPSMAERLRLKWREWME